MFMKLAVTIVLAASASTALAQPVPPVAPSLPTPPAAVPVPTVPVAPQVVPPVAPSWPSLAPHPPLPPLAPHVPLPPLPAHAPMPPLPPDVHMAPMMFAPMTFAWHDQDREAERQDREAERQDREAERKERQSEREASLYEQATDQIYEGRYEKAIPTLVRLIEMKGPRTDAALYWKAYAQNRIGQRAEAHRDAEEALQLSSDPATRYQVAGVYALTSKDHPDDRKEAFRLLASALKRDYGFEYLDIDPELAPIRHLPEFVELVSDA